jgi:hypothetical protein
MKRALLSISFLLAAISAARAQTATAYPVVGVAWHQPQVFVPNSTTVVTNQDSLIGHLHLANASASSVTVTLQDTSTNCNGGACQFWPAIPIAPNTSYDNDFGGMLCTGGIKWSASAANAVVGYIRGNYTLPILSELMVPSPFGALAIPILPRLVARAEPKPFPTGWKNGVVTGSFP